MEIEPGGVFAGYRVLSTLGVGGMGTVYLVEHPHLMRREALKVILAAVADPAARERFVREARSAAALRHPGIVGIHDFGIEDGTPWFTMDYLPGVDLQDAGSLDGEEAAHVVARVAAALDYAHGRGVVHRDVKPANILITRTDAGGIDDVVVLDFGIAKALDEQTGLTGTSVFIGSLSFGAPEAFRGEMVGPAADQYSLAMTAYRLLSGALPFVGTTPHELMRAHLFDEPRSVSAGDPGLAPLDPVLARALAKDPERRYATCTEFAEALYAAVLTSRASSSKTLRAPVPPAPESINTAAHPTVLAPPRPAPATPPKTRRPWVIGAAIGAVLAVVVAVAVGLTVGRGGTTESVASSASSAPAKPLGPLEPNVVSAGCAIAGGSAYCWGENKYGQLGDGSTKNSPTPVEVSSLTGVTAISAGAVHRCAVADGKAYCWGYNGDGRLGAGNTADGFKPVEVAGLSGVTEISAGYDHTCALAGGQVYCWGVNQSGQVGTGRDSEIEMSPVPVAGLPAPVTSLSTGARRTCTVASAQVYCWGQNLGASSDPTTEDPSPVIVPGLDHVSEVSVGSDHVCALASGAVSCWGNNDTGQIGVGAETPRSATPIAVPGMTQATQISAGGGSSCAVVAGAAYCWGFGGNGQLGDGVGGRSSPPVRVTGLSDVTQVAVGGNFACGLAGRVAYCWGVGDDGQLGDGSQKNSSVPQRVAFARS
ncbi:MULTISPECIES: RCC1 domain-containing protein [unclassified Mycolicibacterium]|uniref:RCC1 domain-containing protein n=1 Tax=unclassified Mycolicibacterium TaxID=2636767 RepID=UPI002ED90AD4